MESNENMYPLFCGGTRFRRKRTGACESSDVSGAGTCGEKDTCACPADPLAGRPLAMVYAPSQAFEGLFEPEEGLARGTIFAALDMPFEGDGRWC